MKLKRIVVFTFAVLIISAAAIITVNAESAESTGIISGHYDIAVLENGNAEITETWVLYFDNEKTYRVYFRNYFKPEHYDITNWSATLDGRKMNEAAGFNDDNPEYSFAAGIQNGEYLIELYHRSYGEERTFTISYTVENAVKLYDDAADFVWDLTGENEFSKIGVLTATVTVPQGASQEDFRIWAHGPEQGVFIKDSNTKASLYIDWVYSFEIVDIRVSLPPELFSGGYYVGGEKLDEIMAYEKNLADEANAEREERERQWEELRIQREEWETSYPVLAWFRYSGLSSNIFGGSFFVAFFFIIIFPTRTRKMLDKKSRPKYVPEQNPEYYRTLPDDTAPAVLNNLFSRFNFQQFKSISKGSAFSATMLDLFTEGYLEMRKTADDDIEITVNSDRTPEHDYEQTLISLITAAAKKDSGNTDDELSASPLPVTLKDIQDYINKNQTAVYDIKNKFNREARGETDKSPYIEEYTRDKSSLRWAYVILALVTICYGTFISLYITATKDMGDMRSLGEMFSPMGYGIALIFTVIAGLLCLAISKKGTTISQLGTDKSALWAAFGKFLDDFTSFKEKEFPEFRLWEKYLVYATALGKSKKLIQELALQYPVENINDTDTEDDEFLHHRMFTESFAAGSLFDTIEDIQSRTYSASTPSESSSGSGGGGGFSSSGGSSGSGSSGSGVR